MSGKNLLNKTIIDFVLLIYSLFKTIPDLIKLAELESRALAENMVSILILYLIAGTLLTSIWLCVIAICFVFFISLQLSWILSFFIILVLNVLLLIITVLLVLRKRNNMAFRKTRNLISNFNK